MESPVQSLELPFLKISDATNSAEFFGLLSSLISICLLLANCIGGLIADKYKLRTICNFIFTDYNNLTILSSG